MIVFGRSAVTAHRSSDRPHRAVGRWCGLLLAAPLLLTGCANDGAFEPHQLTLTEKYDNAAARPASNLSRWWTRFGSTSLNALVDAADSGNFDISAASARLEQADAQARIAGAVLLPALTLSGDASRTQSSGTTSRKLGVRDTTMSNAYSGALAASYELDIWGKNRDLWQSAKADVAAADYAREVVRLSTRAGVVNAYLSLAAASDRLAIARENLQNAQRILDIIRERVKVGTGTALDAAQQESLIASQQAAVPELRQSIELSRTALALLMGRPPEGVSIRATNLRGLRAPMVTPGLPSSLLLRRPDIRNAEAQLVAAHADLNAARKELLPSIQLTGRGGVQSAMLATLLRPESTIWSLAAGLTQPIFDGGRLLAQVDVAEGKRRELLETYRKSIVSALVDVENALVQVREGAAREAAQAVVVAKAREAFRLSEERLRLGTIDLQTLLSTQNTLFQAQDALVQSRLNRLQAAVSLFQALGGDFSDAGPTVVTAPPLEQAGTVQ